MAASDEVPTEIRSQFPLGARIQLASSLALFFFSFASWWRSIDDSNAWSSGDTDRGPSIGPVLGWLLVVTVVIALLIAVSGLAISAGVFRAGNRAPAFLRLASIPAVVFTVLLGLLRLLVQAPSDSDGLNAAGWIAFALMIALLAGTVVTVRELRRKPLV